MYGLSTRSPAVARMADGTAPVVKLILTLMGHNLAKTGTSPLNGPIMRQNEHIEPFSALYKLLPVLYFYFRLCDPTLQLTENDLWASRTCKQGNPSPFIGFWGYLHLSGSIIVAKTTSGFNSDCTIQQYSHSLLLESPFVPSSTDRWVVRAKIRQKRPSQ